MHPSSMVGHGGAMHKDGAFNDATWRRGPGYSLCAQNNEAVIPLVAMTIQNDYTVNTDQD